MKHLNTISELFEAQATQTPDAVAVIFEDHYITYQMLNEKANQLGHYLRQQGVTSETPVAICMDRSPTLLATILGILKAGGAYVPLDASHPQERIAYILKDSQAKLLLMTADLKEKFSFIHHLSSVSSEKSYQSPPQCITIEMMSETIQAQSNTNLSLPVSKAQLAYVIYTSGSTGSPKGVLVEHQSVVNYARWFDEYSACQPGQRLDFSSKYIFDMAVTTSIVPLMLGLTVVICHEDVKQDMRSYLNHLALQQVQLIKMTPSYFRVLLLEVKSHVTPLPALQTLVLGGENLSTADCADWLSIYPNHVLINEYGPTEATVAVSQYQVTTANVSTLGKSVPIGRPGAEMYCYILDDMLRPVQLGELGELYIGGLCLARGYLNQPGLTQKHFIVNTSNERLYKTGDLCRQLPDGELFYEGRIDDQIKIRGFRIEPGEIEASMASLQGIEKAVVLAREDHQGDKRLIAYYLLKEGNQALDDHQIRAFLQQHLPDYMVPVAFVRVDMFPLTANGKLDQGALPIPQFITSQHFLMPKTDLEKSLVAIWSEELGVSPIGLKDDFFELGGDSLLAARIVLKINNTLKKNMSLHVFYAYSTIEQLIPMLDTESMQTQLVAQKDTDSHATSIPLSDFQFMLWMSHTFEPKVKKLNISSRRRIHGKLDSVALSKAFEALIQKHEILRYRVSKLTPTQIRQANYVFKVHEVNLSHLSLSESEALLNVSMHELTNVYPWPQHAPMIMARLFHLKDDHTELQISLPHVVCDDISPEIVFSELSTLYLQADQIELKNISSDHQYKSYILKEQHYFHTHFDRDIQFWRDYLKDANTFAFPPEFVVHNTNQDNFSYSTYHEISDLSLGRLKKFCAKNKVSIHDGLCAALRLSLFHCCHEDPNNPQQIVVNLVKSTRNHEGYGHALGCFLRLEPIKLAFRDDMNLSSLSQQVHRSVIHTQPYQKCTGLAKLASIQAFAKQRKRFQEMLIKGFILVYTSIFRSLKLNRQYLNLCAKLAAFERQNHFLVNLNIRSRFISNESIDQTHAFLGLKSANMETFRPDLMNVDHVFDACFMRDPANNKPLLVISANLKPAFRAQIAKEVVRIIEQDTLEL